MGISPTAHGFPLPDVLWERGETVRDLKVKLEEPGQDMDVICGEERLEDDRVLGEEGLVEILKANGNKVRVIPRLIKVGDLEFLLGKQPIFFLNHKIEVSSGERQLEKNEEFDIDLLERVSMDHYSCTIHIEIKKSEEKPPSGLCLSLSSNDRKGE